jgi:glycosyltransferase 2 family protein
VRFLPVALIGAGIAAMVALVWRLGAEAVLHSLVAIGPLGFASVCLIHTALIASMGLAWSALLPETRPWVAVWGRFVRDAGSEVLPLSQVGGYLLGTRAVVLYGVSATRGVASTIVDVTIEFLGQLAYVALGLLWLVRLQEKAIPPWIVACGLAVACALGALFVTLQRHGMQHAHRIAGILGRGWAERSVAGATALYEALDAIYRRRGGVRTSFLIHFGCWIASASEIWVALWFAGQPIPFGAAMVIESLVYALRTAAFVVPNAMGVQEGAYILLGAAFGLGAEMALALSLLKRARDLVIGLPVLALWQVIEGGRLSRRMAAKNAAAPARSGATLE